MIASHVQSKRGSVHARVWLFGIAACIALVVSVALGWLRWDRNSKLIYLGIQYFVLLPAALSAWRADNGPGIFWSRTWTPFLVGAFCCLVFPLAAYFSDSVYSGDESAYLFQARVLADGKLAAQAPIASPLEPRSPLADPKVFERVFRFQHHLMRDGKWFGKYPPGWPAMLAPAVLTHLEAFVNPLAGLGILWLTYRIGLLVFGSLAADFSLLFLVSSPFFTLNCIDFMSHASASFLLALALYFFILAWRSDPPYAAVRPIPDRRMEWYLIAMMASLFVLCMVRPYVAAWTGSVLGAGALWILRFRFRSTLFMIFAGTGTAASAMLVLLLYNRSLTGSSWPLTYALYTNTRSISEIEFQPAQIWKNLVDLTSVSIGETLLTSFPFLFLLALFAVWRDRRRSKIAILLAALVVSLMIGYVGQSYSSFSLIGERYYFETYFLVALLAAWGWILLWRRRQTVAANIIFASLILLQTFLYPVYLRRFVRAHNPSLQVLNTAKGLGLKDAVVFLKTSARLRAFDLNPNVARWRDAPMFMMKDPGEDLRKEVACALGRSQWIVIGYHDALEKPLIGDVLESQCVSVARR